MKALAPDVKERCRWLRWISLAAATGMAVLLLLPLAVALWRSRDVSGAELAGIFVRVLPALFYLYALLAIERSFAALSKGRLLLPVLAGALQRVGAALMAGAATSIILVYNLLRMIEGGSGGYLHFDVPGIALGVVGAALVPLADLLRRAHAVETELDEII